MSGGDEHDGATIQEQLIEACRRNNVDLLNDLLEDKPDNEISKLLNETKTVMGNYLYHEAASYGNYEIIDNLLDQPEFECDPINRRDGDTPLHSAIRWINSEPLAQRPFGNALVEMMLEAGSSTRVKNKARLTPYQLVDPTNKELREIIQKHEYANQNAGDFINVNNSASHGGAVLDVPDDSDDDAEFSGSDEEERSEWERRRKEKQRK